MHGVAHQAMLHKMSKHEVPLLHFVDGKAVRSGDAGALARFFRFLWEPFASSWHHRDLLATVLRRELQERFKGSVAGWVWAVVAPLLSLIVYSLVFQGAVSLPNNAKANSPIDYALFIFGGLIAFNFFSEMAYRAPSLLHEYAHYIKQTMFPPEMLPVISTLRATAYASIALVLMLSAHLMFTGFLHWTVVFLPLWFMLFLAFLMGLTWTLSAIGAYTRDAAYLMMTITPLLLFATPVFYSNEALSPHLKLLMYANILTGFIEILRDIVVFGKIPGLAVCAWTLFLSATMFWFGYWFFGRHREGIADVI